ncbi:aromatic acid exporter family protein [Brevibacterium sp. BDJS002]|uniref:FUSC family protein n=1 Tax=Brevibacterium sp. BDJS002 TaxID=3020906 RepID=UPI002307372A|nr:aromatic acid exporter family protein [Brevibacterium sp. BDJS002]WCE39103.1 aromatic acid exporter family protein [Brevibacterium sp. BDJS002]
MQQNSRHQLSLLARRPDVATDVLQIIKTVIAATGAWRLSDNVLNSQMPFLAPWAALLTVHATVHRSLSRGAQSTIASTLGVGLSFLIGNYLGVSSWTFALALLVGLTAARLPWIRDEGIAIATTGIFVLGSGFDSQQPFLGERILELCIGVAVGIVVNLLVIPPLRDQQAARYVDSINRRMGNMLVDMADELDDGWETADADDWFNETESMSEEMNSAWQSVKFARESQRANPRHRLRRRRTPSGEARDTQTSPKEASYENILLRVDEGISHLRHLTRTLREGSYEDGEWDSRFREQWTSIVRDAGRSIADPDAEVEPIFKRLEELSVTMAADDGLPERSWALYGSLIASMQHIAAIVDDVASAREARESR